MNHEALRCCQRRQAGNHGALALYEALECGLSRSGVGRLLQTIWELIYPGVYVVRGAPDTWHRRLMAACLYAGPGAIAAGLSAAALWGFDGFSPGPVEVMTRRRMKAGRIRFRRTRTLRPTDVTSRNGIPVTTVPRTLLDLAARVSRGRLEVALDSALSQGLISVPAMWRFLNRIETRGRKGVVMLRELLAERAGLSLHAQNGFETKLYSLLRRVSDEFQKQYTIMDGDERVAQVDFALPRLKLALEGQSLRFHSSKAARQGDARKLNHLQRLGWRVLYFYWEDVAFDPDYVLREVRAMIQLLTASR